MVGCVEEEGEEKNESAIPVKDRQKYRCVGKNSITKIRIYSFVMTTYKTIFYL